MPDPVYRCPKCGKGVGVSEDIEQESEPCYNDEQTGGLGMWHGALNRLALNPIVFEKG